MKLMLNGKEVTGMGHYVMAGDIKDATAEDSNVLSGKAYYNNNGKREGTMPNRGGMSAELAAGGSVSIPEGYHNGEGVVRAQELASQTQGDAGAGDIASGKTAWVNGALLTGSLVKGKQVQTGTITVYSGSFSNNQTISTPTLEFKPEGAVFVWVDSDGSTASTNSICAVATSSYKRTINATSDGYSQQDDDITVKFNADSIYVTNSNYKFPKGETMFYVAWGE